MALTWLAPREFLHRHQQAKESRAEAARQVENDARQTWAAMVSAGERAREFAAQADANTEVVKAYKDQFSLDRPYAFGCFGCAK